MNVRSLLAAATLSLLLSACAHRFPAKAGGDREGVAGLALSLGSPQEIVPPGTAVRWDFGDGTSAEGPTASHAWARAGEYTLKIEVTDARGSRSDVAKVRIARRPPATAVPPNAAAAVVVDRFFARLPRHLSVAERILGPEQMARLLSGLEESLGFDATRPEQVLANGLDPEEGLALAWLPEDPGTWLIVGIFDERLALEAVRRALSHQEGTDFAPGPQGSTVARSGDAHVEFATSGGYLYLHIAEGEEAQPRLDFAAPCPPTGLFADPDFARLRAQVEGEDVFAFARGSQLPDAEELSRDVSFLKAHGTALAAGLTNRETEIALQARMTFDAEGQAILARTFAAPGHVPLDAQAPAGAAAYASISISPQALADWLQTGDRAKVDQTLGSAGLGLDMLAATVSGGVALAAYFDMARLLREVAGGGEPKVDLVGALSLKDPKDARARLDAAAQAGSLKTVGEARWEFGDSDGAGAGLLGGAAYFGNAGPLARTLDAPPEARRLAAAVRAAVPAEALQPGHQLLFLDVAGFLDRLRDPGQASADPLDEAQQRQLAMMLAAAVESTPELQPLRPIRDVWADLSHQAGALVLQAKLRLR